MWWAAQWPLLIGGLFVAFAGILYLGPNVDHPRWRFLTPGALLAVLIWLAASGMFAVYASKFGSYNKTWGALSAVVVLLTWFWLSGVCVPVRWPRAARRGCGLTLSRAREFVRLFPPRSTGNPPRCCHREGRQVGEQGDQSKDREEPQQHGSDSPNPGQGGSSGAGAEGGQSGSQDRPGAADESNREAGTGTDQRETDGEGEDEKPRQGDVEHEGDLANQPGATDQQ
jgi:membrane protein